MWFKKNTNTPTFVGKAITTGSILSAIVSGAGNYKTQGEKYSAGRVREHKAVVERTYRASKPYMGDSKK